jgi:hypothetical protein
MNPGDARRRFLRRAAAIAGGAVSASAGENVGFREAAAQDLERNLPPHVPEWSRRLGAPILASPYGVPSKFEANVRRRESPGSPERRNRRWHSHRCRTCSASSRRRVCISSGITPACRTSTRSSTG